MVTLAFVWSFDTVHSGLHHSSAAAVTTPPQRPELTRTPRTILNASNNNQQTNTNATLEALPPQPASQGTKLFIFIFYFLFSE
jgi:hypothetical protein